MKGVFVFLLFFCCYQLASAQQIDDLKTQEEVEKFVATNINSNAFSLKKETECETVPDSLARNHWLKKDFNGDGFLDLFARGCITRQTEEGQKHNTWPIIFLGNGVGTKLSENPRKYFEPIIGNRKNVFLRVIETEEKVLLIVHHSKVDMSNLELNEISFQDTLQFMEDTLIPYSEKAHQKTFSTFKLKSSYCLGTCPVYEFTLNSDGSGTFEGIDYTQKEGTYRVGADQGDLKQINEFLNQMRFTFLNSSYDTNWTDMPTNTTTVTFKDGSKKEVRDYGKMGTLHLMLFYDYLYSLLKDFI